MIFTILGLSILLQSLVLLAAAFPAYPATAIGAAAPLYTPFPNLTALLDQQTHHLNAFQKRQIVGMGICETAMQGFSCSMENHEQNRCAGDAYSYCICAGGANGAGVDGLWLNTAWGPGCEACTGKARGDIFDGTCNGDGSGGRGQTIPEIMATLTITITVVEISSAGHGGTRIRRFL